MAGKRNGKAKPEDLPGMTGPGVGIPKDKKLDQLGGELDDLKEKRADISEKITQTDKNAVDRMKELGLKTYRYGDRIMTLKEGDSHVKTKAVKGDDNEPEEEEAD